MTRAAHLLLPSTLPPGPGAARGGPGGVPEAERARAGGPASPGSLQRCAGPALVGKGLRAPLGAGWARASGRPCSGQRDQGQETRERGGRGFPVTLQRTAVTSRGLLGAVRAGGEAREQCKPAWARIPRRTLETLHQLPSQRLTMRRWVTSLPTATACPARRRARCSRQHPTAAVYRGLPKLGKMPNDSGLHRPTCSRADRHLPAQGSPRSTDTGGHDPASHRRIQEREGGRILAIRCSAR